MTTAYLRGLPRDEGREPGGAATGSDEVQDEPMNVGETPRKRNAEDAGHEADDAGCGGAQPDPAPMVDDSMPELRREAETLAADAVALAEAYSPASRQRAGAFGLSAGVAMDLRLGWDLVQRADPVKAEKRLRDEKPHLLILSPMCLALCLSLSRLQHAKPDELAELQEQGKRHLEFACSLAELQIAQGGRVLFEYPSAASEEPCLWKLRSIDGMRCVRCDQCQFGMTSVDSAEKVGPACKAPRFMTNDEYIAEAVNRHFFGGHDHIQLLSGRAKSCEKYLPRLVAAILRALRQSMRARGCGLAQKMVGRDRQLTISAVEAGPTLEEPELPSLPDNADVDQEFRDRSTGLPLNPEMVKKARELEMQYMEEVKVLEDSDRDACMAETGRPPIPPDWVDINKGDSLGPTSRCRLVCQETRGRSTIDVEDLAATFAATPPYEAFKLQLSLIMTGPRSQIEGDDDVLMLLDISRAHLHSPLAKSRVRDH